MRTVRALVVVAAALATMLATMLTHEDAPATATPAQPGDYVSVFEGRELTDATLDGANQAAADVGASASMVSGTTLGLVGVERAGAVVQGVRPGWRIPMTAAAIDPVTASATMSPAVGAALATGGIVLSATTAGLRGAQAGDTVMVQTPDARVHAVTVALVGADTEVGFTEITFPVDLARLIGFDRPSSVRIWGFPEREALDQALAARLAAAGATDARIRRTWDPPNPDGILPQAITKAHLGEFAVAGGPDPLTVEQSWTDANIVSVSLPIIGTVRCHRTVAADLVVALAAVDAAGLAASIDVGDTRRAGGCFVPREIRPLGSTTGGQLSRHTWGMAIDINPSTNAQGDTTPAMDPRVVEIFRRFGFVWGGGFTIPDGMHFEWAGGPRPRTFEVTVMGHPGIPADATAAVLNVTATQGASDGYLTVYPCDEPRPLASNVNFRRGETVPNLVVAKLGADGKVCVYAHTPVDVVVDLAGAFTAASGFHPESPRRWIDTRQSGAIAAGAALELVVAPGEGVPADASAVVLNVTATDPAGDGYFTVYPCAEALPLASNVNYRAGQTIPNLVIAPVGTAGRVCIHSYATADAVVDLAGWFESGSRYQPATPVRLADTRDGAPVGAGEHVVVPVPSPATVLSAVATDPAGDGFLTVYPCGHPVPLASNVNYRAGQTIANAAIATAGEGGAVCVHTYAASHVVIDATGGFAGEGFVGIAPSRILDTRSDPRRVLAGVGSQSARPWLVAPEASAASAA